MFVAGSHHGGDTYLLAGPRLRHEGDARRGVREVHELLALGGDAAPLVHAVHDEAAEDDLAAVELAEALAVPAGAGGEDLGKRGIGQYPFPCGDLSAVSSKVEAVDG